MRVTEDTNLSGCVCKVWQDGRPLTEANECVAAPECPRQHRS